MKLIRSRKTSCIIRYLVFASAACMCMVTVAAGQGHYPPCTRLLLRWPDYVVGGKTPLPLELEVFGAKEVLGDEGIRHLVFKWTVSDGTIASGQGTPNITLDFGNLRGPEVRNVDLSVDVEGIPPDCNRRFSQTLKVKPSCAPPRPFDTYGGTSLKLEDSKLDVLAAALKANPSSMATILVYAGRTSCLWEGEWRANRAKKYLIEKRGIDSNRVITMDGGFREELTVELFISPQDSCGPLPRSTLQFANTELSGGRCSEKYDTESGTIDDTSRKRFLFAAL